MAMFHLLISCLHVRSYEYHPVSLFIYYRKYLSDSLNGAIEHFDICFYISVCLMYCIAMYPYESYE